MADGKWISGLNSEMLLVDAAPKVLKARFKLVQRFLPLAANHPERDVERVHQVRVGSRRAAAALDLFEICLPKKQSRPLRKRIKKIRRAAGSARDWDVFQAHLLAWSQCRPVKERPGLHFLKGLAFDRRLAAQIDLNELADAAPDPTEAIEHLRIPDADEGPKRFGEHSVQFLEALLAAFHAAMDADTGDFAHLHKIRIIGKRLRYAMEVCVGCFQPGFRETMYEPVEELQDILGTANDNHVTVQWMSQLSENLAWLQPVEWRLVRPGIAKLLQAQKRSLLAQRRRFAVWLKRWRKQTRPIADFLAAPSQMMASQREVKS